MLQYLKVGQIINTHGVKGEVKVYPLTDDINRFKKLKFLYIKQKDEYIKLEIEGVKYLKNFVILKLKGIDDMNNAERHKNIYLYVDRDNTVKLEEDSYFIADLIGLDVITVEGEVLGSITSVFETGSNDVYEVRKKDGKSLLIPAIKDVIKQVDIENGKMLVKLLEGLL